MTTFETSFETNFEHLSQNLFSHLDNEAYNLIFSKTVIQKNPLYHWDFDQEMLTNLANEAYIGYLRSCLPKLTMGCKFFLKNNFIDMYQFTIEDIDEIDTTLNNEFSQLPIKSRFFLAQYLCSYPTNCWTRYINPRQALYVAILHDDVFMARQALNAGLHLKMYDFFKAYSCQSLKVFALMVGFHGDIFYQNNNNNMMSLLVHYARRNNIQIVSIIFKETTCLKSKIKQALNDCLFKHHNNETLIQLLKDELSKCM